MANLLSTCTSESGNIQHISPQNAGWEYVGFDVWQLKAGESITLPSVSVNAVWCWLPGWPALRPPTVFSIGLVSA